MGRLTAEAKNKLEHLMESGRIGSGVALVVVNSAFTDTLRAWMSKPGAPPKDEILILACDAQSEEVWTKEGLAVVGHVTDGTWGDLVAKRHEVLALLCRAGVDAFYSDADAFWLRDPRAYCRNLSVDFACSQGTVLPAEACRVWGFVLCTGFFYAKATTQTSVFFQSVAESVVHSDQSALNLALLQAQTAWKEVSSPSGRLRFRGLHWDEGRSDVCINYYDHEVFGSSTKFDMKFCLLPHSLFSRLGPVNERTMVAHLLEEKSPEWRRHIAALRARRVENA